MNTSSATAVNALDLIPVPGTVVLAGVVGSTAYGLAHAGSDEDVLGVFMADPAELLGLTQVKQTIVRNDPDVCLHELGKFLALAIRCNPTVTELLWLPNYRIRTVEGDALVALRFDLLSTQLVRDAYIGYARAQFKKLTSNGSFGAGMASRTLKHARHMFRLLEQAQQLLTTGHLTVAVADPDWYLNTLPTMRAEQMADEFMRRVSRVVDIDTVLPDTPNTNRVNKALIELRSHRIAAAVG